MLCLHTRTQVPNEMKDVVDIYLNDPRAEKYRKIDREKNGGNLPERTTLISNICFCLRHVLLIRDRNHDPEFCCCILCISSDRKNDVISFVPNKVLSVGLAVSGCA